MNLCYGIKIKIKLKCKLCTLIFTKYKSLLNNSDENDKNYFFKFKYI